MKNYILFAALIVLFASCQLQDPSKQENDLPLNVQQGNVKEVLQTNKYTYLLVKVDDKEVWLAGPKTEASEGDMFYYRESMKMKDFQSKELNRNFDEVIFVNKLSKELDDFNENANVKKEHMANVKTNKQEISLPSTEGVITIGKLYADKTKFEKNIITVKGIVTKYNEGIMGKNWIHLQDGTEHEGNFDLVATSDVKFKLGDTVTLEGKLILDKDYGYGYKYEILLENAVSK